MATLEHTDLVERSLAPRLSYDAPLTSALLVLLAGTAVAAGIVFRNYYVLAGLPLLILAIKYPVEMSLGLFAFLIPFDNVLLAGKNFSIDWVLGAAAGAILLAYGLVSGRLRMPPWSALWWGIFIAWGAETLLWALDPAHGLERLPSAISIFVFYLVVVSFRMDVRELRTVLLFIIAGGVLASAVALWDFTRGVGWLSRAALTVADNQTNPNDFADTLLLPFSLALGGFLSAATLVKRGAMLIAAISIGVCVLLTMSRGSFFGIAALLIVYFVRLRLRKQILIPIALVCAFITVAPSFFFQRMQQALTDRGDGREDIFFVGVQIVKHYPILGVGLDNFRMGYAKFAGFAPIFRGFDRDPHNIYLQVWAELGIIGLALFLTAIVWQLRELYLANRGRRAPPNFILIAIEGACWALLVHGFAANLLWRKQFWLVWILAAIATQLQRSPETAERHWSPELIRGEARAGLPQTSVLARE